MRTLRTVLLGSIVGLVAVAIWKGTRVDANTANYAYADSHPGTPLPAGVYGPPVPASFASLGMLTPAPARDPNVIADNYVSSEGLA
jgi:heme A synthase